jgi:polygalacturonase
MSFAKKRPAAKAMLISMSAFNARRLRRKSWATPRPYFGDADMELLKMLGRSGSVVCTGLLLAASWSVKAQDTRHVVEPTIPPPCATIAARLDYHGDRLVQADAVPQTQAIQKAIDHCGIGRAVELKVAGGHNAVLSGPLTLRTGVVLVVDKDVHLVASNDPKDYDKTSGSCGLSNKGGGGCRPLISAVHADHSGVMGEGVIEGRGDQKLKGIPLTWWEMHDQKKGNVAHNIPWLMGTDSTNDFILYEITLRNAPNFNVFLAGGDGITVWGVKIDAPWNSPNTDGIDPSGCTNVTITHSYIRNGDDNVAIKAPKGKPAEHITVSHNHFYEGHGMSIGSGTEGGVSAVRFADITIDHQKAGIHIKSNPGRGGHVHDVVYEDICVRNTTTPIDVETTYIDANAPREGWINGAAFPLYTDITLHDVQTKGGSRLRLTGVDAQHVTEIRFDGLHVEGVEAMRQQVSNARITLGPGSSNWTPQGDDVRVTGAAGNGELPECSSRFVVFPARDGR